MHHGYVLPAAVLTIDGVAIPHPEVVQVDQHRGVIKDDGQGHTIECMSDALDIHGNLREKQWMLVSQHWHYSL